MKRHAIACALVLAASLVAAAAPASAQGGIAEGLRTILDTNFSTVNTTITDANGAVTTTRTRTLYPRLTLNAETLLYPRLRLSAGGLFDVNLSSFRNLTAAGAGGSEATATLIRLRPFFELRSTNPTLSPGIGYYRRDNRTSSSGSSTVTVVNEDYAAYLGWKPEGLPQTDFQFVRTNLFDGDRAFQDETRDFGSVVSRYSYQGVNLRYQGSYLDNTDRQNLVDTRQISNAGRVDHSRTFFRKRLQWNVTYNIDHQSLSIAARGDGGEVALPVIPFAGLALLSDTPVMTTLSQNPLLIDGNLTAAAGINLGLPGLGAGSQARNIGLDFVNPTEVNRLQVWVDRELPAGIAGAFSWEIYSSLDNLTWRRETVVSTAAFGPFENRFRIDFPAITARYLKVVTRPLSGAVVDAARFPEIFVTEIQAFLARSPDEARDMLERTTQNLNTDVRMRILDVPTLYYEGSYWFTEVPSGLDRKTLSNGASITHRFNRTFATAGRAAFEQGTEPEGPRTATVTNATLTIDPIHTLTTTLLYTGLNERIDGRPSDRNGIAVQTNAQLYRGIAVQGSVGWNVTTRLTGERLRDRFYNVSGSVVPRENLTLTFIYADTRTKRSGLFAGDPVLYTRSGYATLAFDPIPTLHLVLGEEVIAIQGEQTRTTHNIGVNWTPFPDGSLQFLVAYNEAVRPLEFGSERIFRPAVRWTLSRQSFVEVAYQRIDSDQFALKTRTKIFSVDLKLYL